MIWPPWCIWCCFVPQAKFKRKKPKQTSIPRPPSKAPEDPDDDSPERAPVAAPAPAPTPAPSKPASGDIPQYAVETSKTTQSWLATFNVHILIWCRSLALDLGSTNLNIKQVVKTEDSKSTPIKTVKAPGEVWTFHSHELLLVYTIALLTLWLLSPQQSDSEDEESESSHDNQNENVGVDMMAALAEEEDEEDLVEDKGEAENVYLSALKEVRSNSCEMGVSNFL